jgi:hypothetical protein
MRIDMRCAQRENLKMKYLTAQKIEQFFQETAQKAAQGAEGTMDPQSGVPTIDPGNLMSYPPIVPVNKWDNHEVHITTHNNFRKTQAFESLDPLVKDQIDRHVNAHESYVFMKTMNPAYANAGAGMPNDMMGQTPEMATGPDMSGGVPQPGQQAGPGGQPPSPGQAPPQGMPQPLM